MMNREIDFVGKRTIFITISLIIIALSVISIYTKGFNLGLEFTGGSEITILVHSSNVKEADVRETLRGIAPEFERLRVTRVRSATDKPNESKFSVIVGKIYTAQTPESLAKDIYGLLKSGATKDQIERKIADSTGKEAAAKITEEIMKMDLSKLSQEDAVARIAGLLRPHLVSNEKDYIVSKIIEALKEKGFDAEVVSFSEISGSAAEEIRRGTFTAIIVAIIAILIYITFRFNFVFGLGAIIALVHDVLITLGFFSFFGYEMNVPAVAALLTLIGYSLNDTIVVYDRIRENMRKFRRMEIGRIVNTSINQVIMRSINTSLTTFFVVFVLLLFAGKAIKSFAFGMTIGTIVGTYSSLYIAAPIVIKWVKRW